MISEAFDSCILLLLGVMVSHILWHFFMGGLMCPLRALVFVFRLIMVGPHFIACF